MLKWIKLLFFMGYLAENAEPKNAPLFHSMLCCAADSPHLQLPSGGGGSGHLCRLCAGVLWHCLLCSSCRLWCVGGSYWSCCCGGCCWLLAGSWWRMWNVCFNLYCSKFSTLSITTIICWWIQLINYIKIIKMCPNLCSGFGNRPSYLATLWSNKIY